MGGAGACGDEVGDGFSLTEVDVSGSECAAGEFAGFSKSCAGLAQQLNQAILNIWRAMDGELDDVLAGVGMRAAEDCGHGLVEDGGVSVADGAEVGGMRLAVREFLAAPEGVADGESLWAGDAHNGYSRRAGGGGHGADGVSGGVHLRWLRCQRA